MAEFANVMSHAGARYPTSTGGGNVHEYMKFLGPPTGSLQPTAYDKQNFTHYDLAEAYKGRNLFLADTVTGFVMENITWYTTNALPWVQSDQLHFQWSEWKMTEAIAPRVPHEGVSRLLTSSKHTENAHSIRRGMAFTMEADFYRTDEGRTHYLRNLLGLAQVVQETQDHDTMFQLMSTKTYDMMWNEKFGMSRISFVKYIEEEILNYGCAAEPNADRLEILVEEARRTMGKINVTPNMLILGPGARVYLSMVPETQTEFWTAGEQGTIMKRRGPDALGTYRGLQVFETRDFHETSNSPAVQLLTRRSQIAEFHEMFLEETNTDDAHAFTASQRNIYIYDENNNDMAKITFREAFENAGLFGKRDDDDFSEIIKKLIIDYNARGQQPDSDSQHTAAGSHHPPPIFVATHDGAEWSAISHFGQMELTYASHKDFETIGRSIAGKCAAKESHYRDLVALVHEIEMQPYSDAFFDALIRENVEASINREDQFLGEETPADLAGAWGTQRIREWKPNGVGGLSLPHDAQFGNMGFPPGFANAPGLRTLAMEASRTDSPWHQAGLRAQDGISMLGSIVATLQKILPGADALDPLNRAPWFHREDPLTVFFSNVFSLPRDPLFMLHLPAVGGGAGGAVEGARGSEPPPAGGGGTNLPWVKLPGDNVQVWSSVLGQNVEVQKQITAATGGIVGREAQVVSLMPSGDSPGAVAVRNANINILRAINTRANYAAGDAGDAEIRELRMKYEMLVIAWTAASNTKTPSARHEVWQAVVAMDDNLTTRGFDSGLKDDVLTAFVGPEVRRGSPEATGGSERRDRLQGQGASLVGDLPGLSTQYETWTRDNVLPFVEGQGPGQSAVQALDAGVRTSVTNVFENEAELSYIADAVGLGSPDFSAPFSDASVALAARLAASLNTDRARTLAAAIATDVAAVRAALPAGARFPAGGSSGAPPGVAVVDTPATRADSRYYRTPLTSSKAMLESISAQFGDKDTPPLVLPGDPASLNTLPFGGRGTGVLPSQLFERTNYADIASVSVGRIKRKLGDTAMVARRISGTVPVSAASAAGAANFDAIDEDDGSDDEETLEGMFSERYSRPSKRNKTELLGAHRPGVDMAAAPGTGIESDTFRERWHMANDIVDPIVRMATMVFMTARADSRHAWLTMISQDAITPVNIVLFRPFIEHDMQAAIVLRGGIETGANVYGHSNFEVGADVISKILNANFTFYAKAIVWKKQNVQLLMDIKPEAYQGGSSAEFANSSKDFAEMHRARPSLIAVPVPMSEKKLGRFVYIGGPMTRAVTDLNPDIDGTPGPGYSSYELVERRWQLEKTYRNPTAMGRDNFYSRQNRPTLIAARGTQLSYNNKDGAYTRVYEGGGHRTKKAYPGAAHVWNGAAKSFIAFDWNSRRWE